MMRTAHMAAVIVVIGHVLGSWPAQAHAADSGDVRSHADRSFDRMTQPGSEQTSALARTTGEDRANSYPSEQYWIGKGQGDLAKGTAVCQRVSELAARTDLAKQIRVMVKEHMVDRVRERTGRDMEQDIELTREEIVQEYLQGVKIVDHRIDEDNKICTATAVMPKNAPPLKPATDAHTVPPVVR